MMNEHYFADEDYGMELRSLGSQDDPQQLGRRRPERIVLTMPREWLDPKQPLPTDKEFHRWVSEQLRAHRTGRRIEPDNMSINSDRSDSSRSIGRVIQETTSNLLGGILRKRSNRREAVEQQNLLEDDCFSNSYRDNGVVGMELSVLS